MSSPPQGREPPWMSQLTDKQKAEIKQLMDSLKASGKSHEEIRAAIDAKMREWGIKVPPPPQGHEHRPEGHEPRRGLGSRNK